jgi:hypothetical protein
MPDERPPDAEEDLVFRRGKLRKRDDPAIDLFREALASLHDLSRARRALVELGRLYDPVANGPILDPGSRREVLERLEAGRPEEARARLEACLQAYTRKPQPP